MSLHNRSLAVAAIFIACMTWRSTSTPAWSDEPSLADQLQSVADGSAKRLPAEMIQTFGAAINTVRETGIEESAKQVGDRAPDATLSGWDGNTVTLSDRWKQGPVVLMWYRGGWCPYCNVQLRAMQKSLAAIQGAGARLVVLTPELPAKAKETAQASQLDLIALHDRDNQVAADYGILFDLPAPIIPVYRDRLKLPEFNGNDSMRLPLAATYVINSDGVITYAFLDSDYKKRAAPDEVLRAVQAAASR